uniref:Cytochrome c oxidase assembly factor 5 n=1 Tax=Phallusia mammillata TaxID=59560 RepID=A0A6F9D904_9ASCI|nr:cytochrome c oxidase assembly factor 5-like [Phallusia mammillata]
MGDDRPFVKERALDIDTSRACWRIRYELKQCFLNSDCIKVENRSAKECMTDPSANVPTHCRNLQFSYQQCRRSMLDMRTRFRGLKGDSG